MPECEFCRKKGVHKIRVSDDADDKIGYVSFVCDYHGGKNGS